jgi:hypothetical protein
MNATRDKRTLGTRGSIRNPLLCPDKSVRCMPVCSSFTKLRHGIQRLEDVRGPQLKKEPCPNGRQRDLASKPGARSEMQSNR